MTAAHGRRGVAGAARAAGGAAGCLGRAGALILCVLSGAAMASAASADDEQTLEQLTQALGSIRTLATQVAPYDAVFRRDPMRALVNERGELISSAGLQGGLSVQGIIWSDQHPMAVVDDELVAPGDIVGPYTILQIRSDQVLVQRGTEHLAVPLDRGIDPSHEERLPPPQ